MIWHSSQHSVIVKFADYLVSQIAFIVSYFAWIYLYTNTNLNIPVPFEIERIHIFFVLLSGVVFVVLFQENGAYSYLRYTSLLREFIIVVKVVSLSIIILVFLSILLGNKNIPRTLIILTFASSLILFFAEKYLLYYVAKYLRQKKHYKKKIIIIGTGTRAAHLSETIIQNPSWGLEIIGFLTGEESRVGSLIKNYPVLAHYDKIDEIIKTINPDEVIITLSTKRFDKLRHLLESCELTGVQIRLNSDFFGHLVKNITTTKIYDINLISFDFNPQRGLNKYIKRAMDIIISAISLILLSPVFLCISTIIYKQDGLPILYDWKIVGQGRRPLTSWKFRTMVKNADEIKKELMKNNEMSGPVFKITNDPRILPIGKILRKFSLDELPQLFSVLKGDLSLVGPRPPLQYEFKEFDLWHRRKLSVKPGLTCLWQITGRSEITDFDKWAKLDLEYIDNWSLLLDFRILLKTIPVVLFGKGAK